MPGLEGANVVDQSPGRGRRRAGFRFEIIAEKLVTILIDNLTSRLVGEIDRRQAPSNPLDQDRDADEADPRTVGRLDRTNEIGRGAVIRRPRVDRRDVEAFGRAGGGQPGLRNLVVQSHRRIIGQGGDEAAICGGDEHPIDAGVREIGFLQPALGRQVWITGRKNLRDRRECLIIIDDRAAPANVVPHEVRYQLDESLAVALDF